MSEWVINPHAKTNGRNSLMVSNNAVHTPIAEVKMPYIPNGTALATPDAEGQLKNARLIAAAPELLSALKLMAIAVEDIRDTELGEMACLDSMAPCEQSLGQLFEAEAKARAAIAKATGEVTPP